MSHKVIIHSPTFESNSASVSRVVTRGCIMTPFRLYRPFCLYYLLFNLFLILIYLHYHLFSSSILEPNSASVSRVVTPGLYNDPLSDAVSQVKDGFKGAFYLPTDYWLRHHWSIAMMKLNILQGIFNFHKHDSVTYLQSRDQ